MSVTKTGVLLINLGTPDAPEVFAVRRYLREFLSDPRVTDLHPILRSLLVSGAILSFRPKKSTAAYKSIWMEEGPPLLVHSRNLQQALAEELSCAYTIELSMRYGKPSIQKGLENLLSIECDHIIVVPLFPQYSSAASGSAIAKTLQVLSDSWNIPKLTICGDFFDHPEYIDSYTAVITEQLQNNKVEHVLFSYHGLPQRHIQKSQCQSSAHCFQGEPCPSMGLHNRFCYRAQCYNTSKQLAMHLKLSSHQYSVCFQSRLGKTPWIQPYTDELLPELIEREIRHIAVVCPSFIVDCLETLEEIGIRAKEQWQQYGGKELYLIPCLNSHPRWVQGLGNMIRDMHNSYG